MFRNPFITGAITAIGLAVGMIICDWLTEHPHGVRVPVAIGFGCLFGLLQALGVYFANRNSTSKPADS